MLFRKFSCYQNHGVDFYFEFFKTFEAMNGRAEPHGGVHACFEKLKVEIDAEQ